MRSTRLTAIAAATAMLAAVPAGASARGTHHRLRTHQRTSAVGICKISIFTSTNQVTSGEAVELSGQLICRGGAATSVQGQTLTVYGRTAGSGGFQSLGTPSTGSGGVYSFAVPAVSKDTLFYASAAGADSRTRLVRVAPEVKLKGPEETKPILTGARNAVIFSGSVSPEDAGARVVLQREDSTSHEEWHAIQANGVVAGNGEFAITHRFVFPGDANIRVVVRPHGSFSLRGISNTLSYGISQKENLKLTLEAIGGDVVSYGQSVTLTGTVAGANAQPVTLLARTRGGSFQPVAKTTTSSSGKYEFPQTPQASSFYRVISGRVSSTVLFDGVKYVLTAGVKSSSVQSGQQLTFEGTVTPAVVGHPVYLEREDRIGGGFHVVDEGEVTAGGSYAISHVIVGSGNETYRVKVPGDHTNQGVSSTPFVISVTPAPAGASKPMIQSKLPGEGQI